MNKPQRRALTDTESGHIACLLRRCSETQLAALLSANEGTLRGWIKKESWPVPQIEQAMRLTLDDVPRRPPRAKTKPARSSRLQFW
jgi:hypothetical protein